MRPLKNPSEITIIGGGIAGLAAARQAVRLGKLVTLFEGGGIYGGQVATVGQVEGLPLPGDFSGQDLAMHLLDDIRKVGAQVVESSIVRLDTSPRLAVVDEQGNSWHPEAVIVATGASLRRLGVPGERELAGRGVSQCATCDGGFFRGLEVVVVGGGDSAVQEALVLSKTCGRVIVVSRSPLRASREAIDRLAGQGNVSFVWESEVCEILGDTSVRGVRLRQLAGGTITELSCAGVFPFIGGVPNSGFLSAELLTASGHVITDRRLATGATGVFAVGAVRQDFGGTLVEAMAEGVAAAAEAVKLC